MKNDDFVRTIMFIRECNTAGLLHLINTISKIDFKGNSPSSNKRPLNYAINAECGHKEGILRFIDYC